LGFTSDRNTICRRTSYHVSENLYDNITLGKYHISILFSRLSKTFDRGWHRAIGKLASAMLVNWLCSIQKVGFFGGNHAKDRLTWFNWAPSSGICLMMSVICRYNTCSYITLSWYIYSKTTCYVSILYVEQLSFLKILRKEIIESSQYHTRTKGLTKPVNILYCNIMQLSFADSQRITLFKNTYDDLLWMAT